MLLCLVNLCELNINQVILKLNIEAYTDYWIVAFWLLAFWNLFW